jgi:ketosteroid isomerase-like protein
MTVQQVINNEKTINQHVLEGKALDAIDLFYGDDVVMIQKDGYTTTGKAATRAFEENFFSMVTEFRSSKLLQSVVTKSNLPDYEYLVVATWFSDYTLHMDGKDIVATGNQTSLTYWADDKVQKVVFLDASEIIA